MQRLRFESVHDDVGAHKTTLRHLVPHVVVLSLHYLSQLIKEILNLKIESI